MYIGMRTDDIYVLFYGHSSGWTIGTSQRRYDCNDEGYIFSGSGVDTPIDANGLWTQANGLKSSYELGDDMGSWDTTWDTTWDHGMLGPSIHATAHDSSLYYRSDRYYTSLNIAGGNAAAAVVAMGSVATLMFLVVSIHRRAATSAQGGEHVSLVDSHDNMQHVENDASVADGEGSCDDGEHEMLVAAV